MDDNLNEIIDLIRLGITTIEYGARRAEYQTEFRDVSITVYRLSSDLSRIRIDINDKSIDI